MLDYSPHRNEWHCKRGGEVPDGHGTLHRPIVSVLCFLERSSRRRRRSKTRRIRKGISTPAAVRFLSAAAFSRRYQAIAQAYAFSSLKNVSVSAIKMFFQQSAGIHHCSLALTCSTSLPNISTTRDD